MDVLKLMDEEKLLLVEIMNHLDENHKLLDQMESIEQQKQIKRFNEYHLSFIYKHKYNKILN